MRSQLGLLRRGRPMSNGQGAPPPAPPPLVVAVNPPEPDDEQLDARLAMITTPAALDAWVQIHESNLPCRPDDWPSYNLAAKRAWVITNYTPDTLPAEDADAFDTGDLNE